MRIEPTPGRMVLYRPASNDSLSKDLPAGVSLAATVAAVNTDGSINLCVFDVRGNTQPVQQVKLVQDGEKAPEDTSYAHWMPYQVQVASGKRKPVKHAVPKRGAKKKK